MENQSLGKISENEGQVTAEIARANDACTELYNIADSLQSRLSVVLDQNSEEKVTEKAQSPPPVAPMVAMAYKVREIRDQIDATSRMIASMLQRIEL